MRTSEVMPVDEAKEIATAALELSKRARRLMRWTNGNEGKGDVIHTYFYRHVLGLRNVSLRLSNYALVLADAIANPETPEVNCNGVGDTYITRQSMLDKRLSSFRAAARDVKISKHKSHLSSPPLGMDDGVAML